MQSISFSNVEDIIITVYIYSPQYVSPFVNQAHKIEVLFSSC